MINWFNNLKLIKKFNIIIIMLLTMTTVLLSFTLLRIRNNNNILQSEISNTINLVILGETIDSGINSVKDELEEQFIQMLLDGYISADKINALDSYKVLLQKIKDNIFKYYTEEEYKIVDEDMQDVLVKLQELEESLKAGDLSNTIRIYGEAQKSIDYFLKIVSNIRMTNMNLLKQEMDIYNDAVSKVIAYSVITLIVFIILMLLSANKLKNYINTNVDNVMKMSKEIAKGKFDVDIPKTNDDEFGVMIENILEVRNSISGFSNTLNVVVNNLLVGIDYTEIDKEGYEGEFYNLFNLLDAFINNNKKEKNKFVSILNSLNEGKFDIEFEAGTNDNKKITDAISLLQNSLSEITVGMLLIINNINKGNLEFRLDETKYEGGWKELISALNEVTVSIQKPIDDIFVLVNKFEQGDLTYQIENEYLGEFDILVKALNKTVFNTKNYLDNIYKISESIIEKDYSISLEKEMYKGDFIAIYDSFTMLINGMNEVLGTITQSSDEMLQGTTILKELNNGVAKGIYKQVQSIDEVENILKITRDGVAKNVELSEETNKLTNVAKKEVEECNEQMSTMLEAMKDINSVTDKISNIISTINDIAFQTKLLALNASVEAARAGQHGKGFAIVAEEVGNLATRSQKSAEETNLLISETINKVKVGYDTANITASTLSTVVNEINGVTVNIDSISSSLVEQSENVEELSKNITTVGVVANNNLSTFDESNKSANSIDKRACSLKELSEQFKLKDNDIDNILQSDEETPTIKKEVEVKETPTIKKEVELKERPKIEKEVEKKERPKIEKEVNKKERPTIEKEVNKKERPTIEKEVNKKERPKIKKEVEKKERPTIKKEVEKKERPKIEKEVKKKEKSTSSKRDEIELIKDTEVFTSERVELEKEFNKKDMGKY